VLAVLFMPVTARLEFGVGDGRDQFREPVCDRRERFGLAAAGERSSAWSSTASCSSAAQITSASRTR
jgi:hypothetical protein